MGAEPQWVLTEDGCLESEHPVSSVLAKAGPHEPREEEIDQTPSLRGPELILALFLVDT